MIEDFNMNIFEEKSCWLIPKLKADFSCTTEDAAAIVGNIGHESMGFTKLQEMKPTVEGSRGGYGWPQWTGPRRRAYEAYCSRNKLDPASDAANYAYMFVELKGDYKRAITILKNAKGLYNKVVAFELQYEGAGIKHYDSRYAYAQKALAAFNSSPGVDPKPVKTEPALVVTTSKDVDISAAPAPQSAWHFWESFLKRLRA